MYKLVWKALETGATGEGQPVFKTFAMAEETAKTLEEKSPYMRYKVVYVAEDDREETASTNS